MRTTSKTGLITRNGSTSVILLQDAAARRLLLHPEREGHLLFDLVCFHSTTSNNEDTRLSVIVVQLDFKERIKIDPEPAGKQNGHGPHTTTFGGKSTT